MPDQPEPLGRNPKLPVQLGKPHAAEATVQALYTFARESLGGFEVRDSPFNVSEFVASLILAVNANQVNQIAPPFPQSGYGQVEANKLVLLVVQRSLKLRWVLSYVCGVGEAWRLSRR